MPEHPGYDNLGPSEMSQVLTGNPLPPQPAPESELLGGILDSFGGQSVDQAKAQAGTLAAAVESGEVRMEAGVAEALAARCERAVQELDIWLEGSEALTRRLKLGDNADGNRHADTYQASGHALLDRVKQAQQVIKELSVTFRKSGQAMQQTDEAGRQSFQGGAR